MKRKNLFSPIPASGDGAGFAASLAAVFLIALTLQNCFAQWTQKGVDIDGEAANDNSGRSVSMPDANTVAIGAYLNNGAGTDAGHARIYTWNGSAWVQQGVSNKTQTTKDNAYLWTDNFRQTNPYI